MAESGNLGSHLRRRFSRFVRDRGTAWLQPALSSLREIRELEIEVWSLGGVPRDLAIYDPPRRPRDLDLVVRDDQYELFLTSMGERVLGRTRFGGARIGVGDWTIDAWPLSATWAFAAGHLPDPSFESLPATTFFNIEAVAVEVWPMRGRPRRFFERGLFTAMETLTIDINLEPNPYPALCIVRAIVFAERLGYRLSPRLTQYLANGMEHWSPGDFCDVQASHYGCELLSPRALNDWRRLVIDHCSADPSSPLAGDWLRRRQLTFDEVAC